MAWHRAFTESGQSYKDMMEMGYIRNNPDYPKHSKQPYVFTSMNL